MRERLNGDSAAAERHQTQKKQAKGAEAVRRFEAAQANLQRNILDSAVVRSRFMVMATTGAHDRAAQELYQACREPRPGGHPVTSSASGRMRILNLI